VKVALFSDVHSNLEALIACLSHAAERGVRRFVCLGDSVGYGPDPRLALGLIMALPRLVAVKGNHDEALVAPDRPMPPEVAQALSWTRAHLSARQHAFLARLPYLVRDERATYAHASAESPERWEYISSVEQAAVCANAAERTLVFIGHVHVPRVYYETPGGRRRELAPDDGQAIPLSPRVRYVVNVGSVGQPRDGNDAACYVIHDRARETIEFHRVPYDHGRTARKIRERGLPPWFARRLAEGR
jgi:diadenosine tetraphosphatase ApaH/serine/threonine PP2A family protein phosphatase